MSAIDPAAGLDIFAPPRRRKDAADEFDDDYVGTAEARVLLRAILISRPRFLGGNAPCRHCIRVPSIGASASNFFKGALAKRARNLSTISREKRAAAREAAEQEAIAQQQAAEAAREHAAQEFEQNEAMQSCARRRR